MAKTIFDPATGREVKHDARAFHSGTPYGQRLDYLNASRRGSLIKQAVLPTAAAFAPALFPLMASGGGAALPAAATQGVGFSSAPAVAGGLTRALTHPLTQLGAQGLFGFLQQRSQNKANDRATAASMSLADKQLALEQQRLADERTDAMAAREEDKRRWEAEEAYRQSVLARDNEQSAYERSIQDERQNRLRAFDPYRQMAMARLGRYLR